MSEAPPKTAAELPDNDAPQRPDGPRPPSKMALALRWLARGALVLAILAPLVLMAVGPLYRLGVLELMPVFFQIMPAAGTAALVAAGVGLLVAVLVALLKLPTKSSMALGLIAAMLGGAVGGGYFIRLAEIRSGDIPPIHDITTDFDRPPQFDALLAVRDAAQAPNPPEYSGVEAAQQQREAYPDIGPVIMANTPPDAAFDRSLTAVDRVGWDLVAQSQEKGLIEASETSFWFGFTDDIVIRITAMNAGSRIDLRSKSRIGRSDLGANAARIRAYIDTLRDTQE